MMKKKLMVGLLAASMGVSCVPLSYPVPVFAKEPALAGVRQSHYAQLDRTAQLIYDGFSHMYQEGLLKTGTAGYGLATNSSLPQDGRIAPSKAAPVSIEMPKGLAFTDFIDLVPVISETPGTHAYQWLKDGKPLEGQDKAELHISPAGAADEGSYQLQVTTTLGTVSVSATSAECQARLADAGDNGDMGSGTDKTECQHENVSTEGRKDATCTEEGYTGDTVCADCKATVSGAKKIPKKNHFGKATKAVPSFGHDISEAYQSNASEHWQECSCGERANVDVHAFGEWSTVKKETADSDGLRERACTVCGYVEQEAIPTMHVKHSYGKMYGHDTKKHWKLCDECGHPGKKKAHGFGEWETTKQATITETGSQERTCKACGYAETRVLATIPVDPATNEPQAPVSQPQAPAEVKQPSGSGNAPSQAPYQPRTEASGSQGEPATGNYGQDGNGNSHSDTDETGQGSSRPSDETGHEPSSRTSEGEETSSSGAARTDADNGAPGETSNDSAGSTASGGAMDAMNAGSKDGTKKSNVPTLEETASAHRKTVKSNLFLMLGGVGILLSAVISLILCTHNAQMADGFEEDDEADE